MMDQPAGREKKELCREEYGHMSTEKIFKYIQRREWGRKR
jgi:hypothetical protein